MKFHQYLTLMGILLLSIVSLVSSQKPDDDNNKQAALYKAALESPKGFVEVDSEGFDAIFKYPRDYAVTALFTSNSPTVNCPPCRAFQPGFESLTKAWKRNKDKKKNVFILLEFVKNGPIFKRYGLNHAPLLYTFPASVPGSNSVPEKLQFEFDQMGFEPELIALHLSRALKVDFKYSPPFNYQLIASSVSAFLVVVGTIVVLAPRISKVFQSAKPFFMLACIGTIILFTSGQMWNQIRGAPYITMDQNRRPVYFAGGFQQQNGVETQIVGAIYALLAFSFIALTVLVPAQRDPTRQKAGVYVWSIVFLGTFSVLFLVFRMKNPSYPFRLFL